MKPDGIRILDKKNNVISVKFLDILKEIKNGNSLSWSILFVNARGHLGEGLSLPKFEQQVNASDRGLEISWDSLNSLASKFDEIFNITVLGCKDKELLRRYENDQEMYESCDVVIEMIDSSYWEVFSKDSELISTLTARFKNVEFLETDFNKNH